jgi:hypothetical protein
MRPSIGTDLILTVWTAQKGAWNDNLGTQPHALTAETPPESLLHLKWHSYSSSDSA